MLVRQNIAGVPVSELVDRFGTPLYVYDGAVMLQRLEELRDFDVVRYAQKACSNLAVLALLRRAGALVDAVSAGEIYRALAAGYHAVGDPPPIVYCADVFDRAALELVVRERIHVNCGSLDMIEQYGQRISGQEITLRINPGFGHGHSLKTNTGGPHSKHGIWHEQLAEAIRLAEKLGVKVTGLHMHIGSGSDFEHLGQVCGAMEKVARMAKQAGADIRSISAGGGIPIPYRPGEQRIDLRRYYQLWDATRRRLAEAFEHAVRLEIEPGRYLVAESGFLIAEIRAVKTQGSNRFYVLDAGFNCLARPILYGAYHPMSVAYRQGAPSEQLWEVVVGGPLCESGDIFTQSEGGFVERRTLPAAQVGDYVVLECAGAYGFTMASNYNSHPLPAEVLILDGRPYLVRKRQSYQELFAAEEIPAELSA
jgi:diaminopimelate decarboxylase